MERDGRRGPAPRWVRSFVAAFVVFELTAGAVLVARGRDDGPTQPPPAAAPSAPGTSAPRTDTGARAALLRSNAIDALLARRARALASKDRDAFETTLDSRRAAFVRKQLAMFDALRDVPLAGVRYDLHASDTAEAPRAKYAGDETYAPRVTLRYRLRGFDTTATAADQFFTFVRRAGEWLVASDDDFAAAGRRTSRDLWDFGPVSVVRGDRTLVLGHPGHHALLRDVARHADDAVPRVDAVWGTRWARKAVVVVPDTEREVQRLIGEDGDLSRIAAVAVSALPGGAGQPPVGERVIVNPPNFARLGTLGRRIVLTHEVTHLATRAATRSDTPSWLVEGLADYVGYLGTGLSARAICQELAADVRARRAPTALPADSAFDGGNAELAEAYEAAWLAVRLIAERTSQAGLVAFYRSAGADGVAAALDEHLGRTVAGFTADWRRYVTETLG